MRYRKPRQHTRKEKIRRKKRFFLISFLLVVICVNMLYILNHPFLKLKEIQISGNETILEQDIQDFLSLNLEKKFLFLFPKNAIVFVNPQSLARSVENHFPRIYAVEGKIIDGNILTLNIEEREPHSLWCRNKSYENDFDEECFFADQRGYIYSRAPYFSEGVFEKIYTNPEALEIGKEVLDKKDFSDFFDLIKYLEEKHKMFFTQFLMQENGGTKLYFSLLEDRLVEQEPFLIYDQLISYEQLKENMKLLRKVKSFQKEFRERPSDLIMIDFRIPNQLRYTFKQKQENDTNISKNNE